MSRIEEQCSNKHCYHVRLSESNIVQFAHLPLVVGPNAAEQMTHIQDILSGYPVVSARVKAMIQHPSGRWDLRLDDGTIRVKLPEKNIELALNRLMQMQIQRRILDREIAEIDLRISDRLTLSAKQEAPV